MVIFLGFLKTCRLLDTGNLDIYITDSTVLTSWEPRAAQSCGQIQDIIIQRNTNICKAPGYWITGLRLYVALYVTNHPESKASLYYYLLCYCAILEDRLRIGSQPTWSTIEVRHVIDRDETLDSCLIKMCRFHICSIGLPDFSDFPDLSRIYQESRSNLNWVAWILRQDCFCHMRTWVEALWSVLSF